MSTTPIKVTQPPPATLTQTDEVEFDKPGPVCHLLYNDAPLCGRRDGCGVDPALLRDVRAEFCELCGLRLCRKCVEQYLAD